MCPVGIPEIPSSQILPYKSRVIGNICSKACANVLPPRYYVHGPTRGPNAAYPYTPSGGHSAGDGESTCWLWVGLLVYLAIGGKSEINLLPSFYLPMNQLSDGVCQHEPAVTTKGEGGQRGKTPCTLFLSVFLFFFLVISPRSAEHTGRRGGGQPRTPGLRRQPPPRNPLSVSAS